MDVPSRLNVRTVAEGTRMIQLDDRGLVSAIVQDDATGRVLMLGYMNTEALDRTLNGENVWFYSRSGPNSGSRARHPAISSRSSRCTWTATATPYSSRPIR